MFDRSKDIELELQRMGLEELSQFKTAANILRVTLNVTGVLIMLLSIILHTHIWFLLIAGVALYKAGQLSVGADEVCEYTDDIIESKGG